jgi:hypothetical protein
MTPASEARWVSREINQAEVTNRPIFPLLLDGHPFMKLNELQYEDVRGGRMPSREFVEELRQTIDGTDDPGGGGTSARTLSLDSEDEDTFRILKHIYSRATDAGTTFRVLRFLRQVADLGTTIEIGRSKRTPDGQSDYDRILRTRISHPVDRTKHGPSLWSHILRDQLEVTNDEFWHCVRNGAKPRRGGPDLPAESLPAELVYLLVNRVGLRRRSGNDEGSGSRAPEPVLGDRLLSSARRLRRPMSPPNLVRLVTRSSCSRDRTSTRSSPYSGRCGPPPSQSPSRPNRD